MTVLKLHFSQSLSLDRNLSVDQTYLLEFDQSMFDSHWRW